MVRYPRLLTASCLALALTGCSSTGPTTHELIETLPAAAAVGTARHLSYWLERDLDAATGVGEADKADLRARAQILAAHADRVGDALDRFDETHSPITVANLKARGDALDDERKLVWREWSVWQVRHGLRNAEDIDELFDNPAFKSN